MLINIYWVVDVCIVVDEFRVKIVIIFECIILNGIDCENFMVIDVKVVCE